MLSAELKAFYRVARLGSITQAAKKLGLSQPTVTTQIRNLESQYSVELFYRGGRQTELLADYEQRLIKNDFAWASKNRDEILTEWRKRYDGKSEKVAAK